VEKSWTFPFWAKSLFLARTGNRICLMGLSLGLLYLQMAEIKGIGPRLKDMSFKMGFPELVTEVKPVSQLFVYLKYHQVLPLTTPRLFIPSLVRSENPLRHSIYSSTNQCKWIIIHQARQSGQCAFVPIFGKKMRFSAPLPALVLHKMMWICHITDQYVYSYSWENIC
jgi:hypothetical protein